MADKEKHGELWDKMKFIFETDKKTRLQGCALRLCRNSQQRPWANRNKAVLGSF